MRIEGGIYTVPLSTTRRLLFAKLLGGTMDPAHTGTAANTTLLHELETLRDAAMAAFFRNPRDTRHTADMDAKLEAYLAKLVAVNRTWSDTQPSSSSSSSSPATTATPATTTPATATAAGAAGRNTGHIDAKDRRLPNPLSVLLYEWSCPFSAVLHSRSPQFVFGLHSVAFETVAITVARSLWLNMRAAYIWARGEITEDEVKEAHQTLLAAAGGFEVALAGIKAAADARAFPLELSAPVVESMLSFSLASAQEIVAATAVTRGNSGELVASLALDIQQKLVRACDLLQGIEQNSAGSRTANTAPGTSSGGVRAVKQASEEEALARDNIIKFRRYLQWKREICHVMALYYFAEHQLTLDPPKRGTTIKLLREAMTVLNEQLLAKAKERLKPVYEHLANREATQGAFTAQDNPLLHQAQGLLAKCEKLLKDTERKNSIIDYDVIPKEMPKLPDPVSIVKPTRPAGIAAAIDPSAESSAATPATPASPAMLVPGCFDAEKLHALKDTTEENSSWSLKKASEEMDECTIL